MLEFLFRKIINNKWLFLCLLIGALAACGVFSTIPLYTNAILQKVLTKDLENNHLQKGKSPGAYTVQLTGGGQYGKPIADQVRDIAQRQLSESFSLPAVDQLYSVRLNTLKLRREGDDFFNDQLINAYPMCISNHEKNIKLIRGRIPARESVDGVYEVAVSIQAMGRMQLLPDREYTLEWTDFFTQERMQIAKIKIVGIFTVEDLNSLYWSDGRYYSLGEAILFYEEQINSLLEKDERVTIRNTEYTKFFDYRAVKIEDVDNILSVMDEQRDWNDQNGNMVRFTFPMLEVLENYQERKVQLRITLWILTIPMMLIICFYTMMISGLIIRNSRNEISVIKSRGAGRLQVFMLFMTESLVLAILSFFAGPRIGNLLCQFLGSSNGFLEFINRKALIPVVNTETYLYSALAAVIFMLFMMAPVLKASTTGIVEYKRSLNTKMGKPFWQKFYLDVLVLAACGYGYYNFNNRQDILGQTGISGVDLTIDPMLFFISTFFILGISLLFLRLYPLVIRFIFKLGSRFWSPVTYFSLVNVSKADNNQQYIMLFIILSLSFGIINANQARTINSNTTDRVLYQNGVDIVIEPYNNLKHVTTMILPNGEELNTGAPDKQYQEPPYELYKKIEGVEAITRVVVDDHSKVYLSRDAVSDVRLLGITPHEFGEAIWFRNDLLPHHLNEYLNLLTSAPTACFLSNYFAEEMDVREGDTVNIRLEEGDTLPFTVYGFVEYFPTCNPYAKILTETDKTQVEKAPFVVVNRSYLAKKLPSMPSEIWIKKQPGVSDSAIYDQLGALQLRVERVDYTSQRLIEKKNDPMLLGTNGVLTMCFIVTMLIAAIGFLLFWILSIREKSLKFGIFRAMGMPMGSVTLIMLMEQFLVSVIAIVFGVFLGTISSTIFIPMLEMIYSAYQQVPPFKIVAEIGDYVKVLGIAGIMLFSGLIFLYGLVRSINVHQVLKMGEDS
ncbi:MAG: ABC transporter permease [Thermoclostridium sp.]|nr:ABC transporter permease [Thermoclostridium sp.]